MFTWEFTWICVYNNIIEEVAKQVGSAILKDRRFLHER